MSWLLLIGRSRFIAVLDVIADIMFKVTFCRRQQALKGSNALMLSSL